MRDIGLFERAVAMRHQGLSYREIQGALNVPKSTLSGWLKNVPLTEEHRRLLESRKQTGAQRRANTIRAARLAREQHTISDAAAQIGPLTDRELFLAGVVAYWAEGSKTKPGGPRQMVKFVNSDPGMVNMFLSWLELLGLPLDAVAFRIAIHESADLAAAERHWSRVVGVPPDRFLPATLKRHNPRTARKNVGAGYHGCLRVEVRRSTELNTRIEGWVKGIVRACSRGRGRESHLLRAGSVEVDSSLIATHTWEAIRSGVMGARRTLAPQV